MKNKDNIYTLFLTFYRRLRKRYTDDEKIQILLKEIICKKIKDKAQFFFIQIGSNDGKSNDPLFQLISKYHLNGILIEPIPYIFQRLIKTYKNKKDLFFENIAIGNPEQNLVFYRVKEMSHLVWWHNQLGSFKKEIILKHKYEIPDLENLIVEEKITVNTFSSLVEKYSIKRIDLLHIDTEGYDYEIIKTVDLRNYEIENILFENKHLSNVEFEDCIAYLKYQGFSNFIRFGGDTFCSKTKI